MIRVRQRYQAHAVRTTQSDGPFHRLLRVQHPRTGTPVPSLERSELGDEYRRGLWVDNAILQRPYESWKPIDPVRVNSIPARIGKQARGAVRPALGKAELY